MKKIITFTALALSVTSAAFATDSLSLALTTTGLTVYGSKTAATALITDPLIGKTSTGVGVGAKTASTGYAIVTQHKNGTKAFGSSMDSTSVYTIPVTVTSGANVATTSPSNADSTLFSASGTSWTAM